MKAPLRLSFRQHGACLGAAVLLSILGWHHNCQAVPQSSPLAPANLGPHTDKLGNEWYLEQNGMIANRSGRGSSILSGAMMLSVGSEQFYGSQPMATADGKEIVLMGQQPTQGLQVTRHIRFLDKEGGLLFLDVFMNQGSTDMTANIEYRHNFSGNVKSMLTDAGRPVKGVLEKEESGVLVLPSSAGSASYGFMVCTPRNSAKPNIMVQSQNQVTVRHAVVVPAGKSVSIVQSVMQARTSPRPDAKELEKVFKPFALSRHFSDWPKNLLAIAVNVRGSSADQVDLAAWFPEEIQGVKREAVDVLAMGEGTRLRGQATCARFTVEHRLGKITVPWEKVIALCGARHPGVGPGRVYLNDGQVLSAGWQAEELRFEMTGGLRMDLKTAELDVLVRGSVVAATQWPAGVTALVENGNGERFALKDTGDSEFLLVSAWGARKAKLADLNLITQAGDEGGGALARFTDGSRLRVWLGGDQVGLQTSLFGPQKWSMGSLRAVVCAVKIGTEEATADDEPARPFVDLAGEQRLMTSPADAVLHFVTPGGVVPLEVGALKEMHNASDELPNAAATMEDAPAFQVQLWGGGTILGRLRESGLRFAVNGTEWFVPAKEIVRMVNPTPRITDATLARIGALIRDLGHEEWKTREKATAELKGMGELARPSLQEAMKQSEDPEVKRRLEQLLGDIE